MSGSGPEAENEENVVMSTGECEVTILPRFGGKIASIRFKGHELLQQPLRPIAPRTPTMGFDESDASGWDECLPSVAACSVSFAEGQVEIPDHGDLWRVAWEKSRDKRQGTRDKENSLTLVGRCFSLPLELERTVELKKLFRGTRIQASYKLTNTGSAYARWMWAAHPLFAVEAGDRIVLSDAFRSLHLGSSAGGRLAAKRSIVGWPIAELSSGGETDLSLVLAPDSGVGDKLFTRGIRSRRRWDGWCELRRPSAGVEIRVSFFDPVPVNYLGLWLCYGGWPEREGPKQMCVAVEPTTAPRDSLAAEAWQWRRSLQPGASHAWNMHVDISPL